MGIQSHRRGRIARRGTRTGDGPDHFRMAERRGHPVILKRAGRVHAFVLQKQLFRIHPHLLRQSAGLLQERLTLAHADLVFVGTKVQQFPEPPHARKIQPVVARPPAFTKITQLVRHLDSVPVVSHVEQVAARRALEK